MTDAFSAFHNSSIEVRTPAERSFDGTESSGSSAVLRCPGDWQSQGRALQRLRQEHEKADGLFFAAKGVDPVSPQDEVTIKLDTGEELEGIVQEVMPLDDKLLVTLQ